MLSAIGSAGHQPVVPAVPKQAPAPAGERPEEVTVVITHCPEHHRHTRACPHTTFTRPAGEFEKKGRYVDVLA